MDLAHIPLRGFPLPNPLVPVSKSGVLFAAALRVSFVVVAIAACTSAVWVAVCAFQGFSAEPWLRAVWKVAFLGLVFSMPAMIPLLWGARAVAARYSQAVVPARILSNAALAIQPKGGALRIGLVGAISPETLMSASWKLEHPFIEFEYVQDYQLRHVRTRIDRGCVWNAQPGEVLWLTLPGFFRYANSWSPSRGFGKADCRVGPDVAGWFEHAANSARRRRHERRTAKLKGLKILRRKRMRYSRYAPPAGRPRRGLYR